MVLFAQMLLTIFAKSFILDVWLGSEYASAGDHYRTKQKKHWSLEKENGFI